MPFETPLRLRLVSKRKRRAFESPSFPLFFATGCSLFMFAPVSLKSRLFNVSAMPNSSISSCVVRATAVTLQLTVLGAEVSART